MLKSLFGDLTPLRDAVTRSGRASAREQAKAEFASTTVLGLEGDADLYPVEREESQTDDLMVNGSPAQAMRAHFASSRRDTFVRQKLITMCDPSHMWAASVIRALADASGRPIERLSLRDQTSLNLLATIERTTLPRRTDDTLKIYHADIEAEGDDAAEVQTALMERSDLSVVIVGPMPPSAVESMLLDLLDATHSLHWQCRNLLFMLPVGATWMATKIDSMDWPDQVRVESICESLTSASAVWNRMLTHWQKLRRDASAGSPPPAAATSGSAPMPLADFAVARQAAASTTQSTVFIGQDALTADPGDTSPGPSEPVSRQVDLRRALAVMGELAALDGLIYIALVNGNTGQVITCPAHGPDIDRAAMAASEIWKTHRRTLRQMGHSRPGDPLEEILVTAGSRYHILRTLRAHPDLFILAVLDKLRSNLAMTRYRIMEAQQVLM